MKRSIEDTPVVMVGAGNLATHVAKALYRKGFRIVQVFSRTEESARTLAQMVEASYTTVVADIVTDACLYVVAVTDAALPHLLPAAVHGRENGLWVHTAGSMPIDIWQGVGARRYGVFYPMQTFSKQRDMDFSQVPVFVEANSEDDTSRLMAIASVLSGKVYRATSEQRRYLHLAAVFACNFTNHMYALAADLLARHGLPFSALLPLIDETAGKVHQLPPREAQTGPAVRRDQNVMDKHLEMLAGHPDLQALYDAISRHIIDNKE